MPKITLDDTSSGYNLSKINSNFQKIEDELNNKVMYRNNPVGEANQLESDVDANGKKIYNVQELSVTDKISVRGKEMISKFEGLVSESEAAAERAEAAAELAISSGSDVFQAEGTGSVQRSVLNKLREFVSVKDFGAKGDGVSDDTLSLKNAIEALRANGGTVFLPGGFNLRLTSQVSLPHTVILKGQDRAKVTVDGAFIGVRVYTDKDDLDFAVTPLIENISFIGTASALGAIKVESSWAPRLSNVNVFNFPVGTAITMETTALTSGARWIEGYEFDGLNLMHNKVGIHMKVGTGTTSFGYGRIKAKISNRTGTSDNLSTAVIVETSQLYGSVLDLTLWNNGYGTGLRVGSSTYTSAAIYWCDLTLRGEESGTNNVGIDITNGNVIHCTGSNIFNGSIVNPNNKKFEILGQWLRTAHGYNTITYSGVSGCVLRPMIQNRSVTGYPNEEGYTGLGLLTGSSNVESVFAWGRDTGSKLNGFGVCSLTAGGTPNASDPVFFAYTNGDLLFRDFSYQKPLVIKNNSYGTYGAYLWMAPNGQLMVKADNGSAPANAYDGRPAGSQFQTASGAPTVVPNYTGEEYFDQTAKTWYKSVGTASSADWKLIT